MSGLIYLLQVNVYLIAFYAFYRIFLRNETFFNLNRAYLVSGVLMSFFIPVLNAQWVSELFITNQVKEVAATISLTDYNVVYLQNDQQSALTLADVMSAIYYTGAAVFLLRLVYLLYTVTAHIRTGKMKSPAFSFFSLIRINSELGTETAILTHEKVHVKQLHSADVLLFEIAAIINWFNPVSYFYKTAIKNIHEYIADEKAAGDEDEKPAYAMLLVSKTFGIDTHQLTNNFFNQSLLKKRIMMLQKSKSKKLALLKYGLTAPLFIAMLIVSSAFVGEKSAQTINAIKPEEITIQDFKPLKLAYTDTIPDKKKIVIDTKDTNTVYVVDGKPISPERLKKLNSDNIKSVFVTKDTNAVGFGRMKDVTLYVNRNGGVTDTIKGVNIISTKSDGQEPVYIVNGVPTTKESVNKINTSSIKSINVTKGQDAEKIYGQGYQNGTIEIKTKDGAAAEEVVVKGYPAQQSDVKDFSSVEVVPQFPGGLNEFYKYVGRNFKYPKEAVKNKVSGRLILSFIVEKSGELTNIKLLRDLGYGTGAEAVRLLENCPLWEPGIQNGKPVRVSYTLPIALNINK